ncbi:rRNA maturation RNase YbeY [Paracoccus albicereus]
MRPPDVVIEDERWSDAGLERLAETAALALQEWLRVSGEIVVMGCDDRRIAGLNAEFRDKPKATNVLSWPSAEHSPREPGAVPDAPQPGEWGDIAIAYETCVAEARAANRPLDHHVIHLLVHAGLHLVGYDHEDDRDAETMQQAERSILQRLSIPDPYEPDLADD